MPPGRLRGTGPGEGSTGDKSIWVGIRVWVVRDSKRTRQAKRVRPKARSLWASVVGGVGMWSRLSLVHMSMPTPACPSGAILAGPYLGRGHWAMRWL